MPESKPPTKLRVPDVTETYGLTERHIRQLVHERRIPFYKVGKLLMFDRDELDEWFEEQRVEVEVD